jgi:alanyl-tRNA synthetase
MTRLDQTESYRTEFEAWLDAIEPAEGGAWWRLDRSAFYPTSGGQEHDTGSLHAMGTRWLVEDVALRDDAVWHRVRRADADADGAAAVVPKRGAAVTGHVDWPRRFAHMQRHTGQHLLSQAFVRLNEAYATRSVGLSSPDATLDLAGEPGDEAIAAAETLVNEVAARALPVRAFEVHEDDLAGYPLRRPPKVRGRIRLVEMGTWERSACGGTHLRSTAEALPLLVVRRERIRGGLVRVTFRAGLEATAFAAEAVRAGAAAAALLSSALTDLPARVASLQEEVADTRRRAAALQRELARGLAERLLSDSGAGALLAHRLPDGHAGLEADVADALATRGATAVIAAVHGDEARLVAASGAGVDVRPALQAALAELGGRGGGRPERAQGGGPRVEALDAALGAARAVLAGARQDGGA